MAKVLLKNVTPERNPTRFLWLENNFYTYQEPCLKACILRTAKLWDLLQWKKIHFTRLWPWKPWLNASIVQPSQAHTTCRQCQGAHIDRATTQLKKPQPLTQISSGLWFWGQIWFVSLDMKDMWNMTSNQFKRLTFKNRSLHSFS